MVPFKLCIYWWRGKNRGRVFNGTKWFWHTKRGRPE